MTEQLTTQEQQLCQVLADLPARYKYRYSKEAANELLNNLFWSLAGGLNSNMRLLFADGKVPETMKLSDAQGAVEGAEYTEAARGKRCGHIFKAGEASYMCRTCGTDDTCCLCSRCFDSTDHTGHIVRIQISFGNSGCCDCGDDEAWKTPLFCTIHSDINSDQHKGKGKEDTGLPEDFKASIQMTIGRVLDYICDVISCSPEQLRHEKTKETILKDEETSRLSSAYHGSDVGPCNEFALVLWNDEKHTVRDVEDQVARACRKTLRQAAKNAWETDAIGRSILTYNTDVERLLQMSKVMEAIRVTMTIRSARDTFREQMCGTLVEWLSDISGCSVGVDNLVLRHTICEEVMKPWRQGSLATQTLGVIDDEDEDDRSMETRSHFAGVNANFILALQARAQAQVQEEDDDDESEIEIMDEIEFMEEGDYDDDDDELANESHPGSARGEDEEDVDAEDVMMVDARGDVGDVGMNWSQSDQALEEDEATMAGYPPPPPPPPAGAGAGAATVPPPALPTTASSIIRDREGTPSDSDAADPLIAPVMKATANKDIPQTPGKTEKVVPRPGRYWIETPAEYTESRAVLPAEDVFQRVRLDWLLLFDLRMWKKVRNDLRSLYITTVVQIPEFKRVLALRFSSLYTVLAQLYLVGDREPDHSIINLSLQMLTTPSITAEVVERGNFMSSLLAILYTFLTTRQVGHPWDISPDAVLGFESGSVTNRRMYHFYQDLKYLFGAPHVQEKVRSEPRYLMQFLDLVKLHQGIGPNIRAVVEHVEYEADSWITASMVTRYINLQARTLTEAFRECPADEMQYLQRAIRFAAKAAIINSLGAERQRFTTAEIKDEVQFKTVTDFEFDGDNSSYEVVRFVVDKEPISFHHALHYTLSWLVECGKALPAEHMKMLLSFTPQELKAAPKLMGRPQFPKHEYSSEDYLMAAFDYPLRVCVWLAQIKANMWVRNGISLRHQAVQYKGVGQRDVSHHRDIFLLQTAMVVCNPSRVLASIVDRFGMEKWVKGLFELKSEAQDDSQHLDVVEDMIHLLIVLLSDRTSLVASEGEAHSRLLAMRRDITHVLCFKPLSFNDITNKLPEKYQEQEDFHEVLDEMTIFKPPEGVSDVGTFELRPEFIEGIDPYIAHYNKNQREESEMAYRKKMATKSGKSVEEIVYEPSLRPITSGLFQTLSEFTSTGIFSQIIYYCLLYPLMAPKFTPTVPATRLETFLQVVLHLMLIAIHEDKTTEEDQLSHPPSRSFVQTLLTKSARSNFMPEANNARSIVSLLNIMSTKEEFKAAQPKISLIMKRIKQRRPASFSTALSHLGIAVDRLDTASPANNSAEEERERKKKAALSRQAKVMAQFQQQQKSFMENQGEINWGSDIDEDDESEAQEDKTHNWKYPTGTCILCQEDADDRRLYGSFALLNNSRIIRQTNFQDPDMVREASQTPCNLDRSAEDIRPFGIARENRKMVEKINSSGEVFLAERQTIGKGYAGKYSRTGPVASGCGHMMHFRCFEQYYEATNRRHSQQIARHHPEDTRRNEFVCPLCKARGNAFLPIVWKGMDESYPGYLQPQDTFDNFLEAQMGSGYWLGANNRTHDRAEDTVAGCYTPSLPGSLIENMISPAPGNESPWGRDEVEQSQGLLLSPSGDSEAAFQIPSSAAQSNPLARDLITAYQRLRDTLRVNDLDTNRISETEEDSLAIHHSSSVLVQTVGFTISSVELQQRGVEAQPGLTLLEKISEQVITHLRVFSETASSYVSVGSRYAGVSLQSDRDKDSERQHCQLFISRYFGTGTANARRPVDVYAPLLNTDIFIFFVECAYGLAPTQNAEISHLMRLCYLAELVKVVFHMSRNIPTDMWLNSLSNRSSQDPAMNNFAEFALAITRDAIEFGKTNMMDSIDDDKFENLGFQQPGTDSLEGWYTFAKKYALVFLRKCVILLHVKYGVDFNSHFSPNADADELDRLTVALRIPTFDEMCASLTPNAGACGWSEKTVSLVAGWVKHQILWPRAYNDVPRNAMLSHPGIFELIGLPKTYDTLIEEATRRRCPTTGKDLTDPVICLFCGELFCSQATCCQKSDSEGGETAKIGGAQQHMKKCQQNIGVYLNVRKCTVVYLFRRSGSFTPAPYTDKYGETDHQLRHGRQLFLNQKRYDSMIRNTVLNHGVPSLISRKLEADINHGGWDTL